MNALQMLERFENILHYALHVRDTEDGQKLPWSEIGTRMHLLAEAERVHPAPTDADNHISAQDMDACLQYCRFATYALVDEILMESPHHNTNSAMAWYQHRLQVRYMNTDRAGELFFTQLFDITHSIIEENTNGEVHGTTENVVRHTFQNGEFPTPLFQQHISHNNMPKAPSSSAYHAPFSTLTFHEQFKEAVSICLADKTRHISMPSHKKAHCVALNFYAICIIYGFKGLYYDNHTSMALEDIRRSATALCQGMLPTKANNETNETVMTPALYGGFYGGLNFWYIIFLIIPLLLTGLWYFVCADIMGQSLF